MMDQQAIDETVQAAVVGFGGLGLPGEVGADAQADLAQAVITSTVQVNAQAVRAFAFIREYLGPIEGDRFIAQLLRDKRYQAPGAPKLFIKAIQALSLYDYMKGVNLNLGGK